MIRQLFIACSMALVVILTTAPPTVQAHEWIRVTDDGAGLALAESGKPYIPWGFDFCFGKSPAECRSAGTIQDAIAGAWLETSSAQGPFVDISPAVRDNRLLRHTVTCDYQECETEIRVLLPDELQAETRYPVLYVLPVEAGNDRRWGNSSKEVLQHDLHNKYGLICVFPTFSHLPWYADHSDDMGIRQESYFVKVVVPFIERVYPAKATSESRLLVGFSKSGFGAWSLLLRFPDRFGRAAAWDSPLMMERPDRYGMGPIFGTADNFANYHIPSLLKKRAEMLSGSSRLILLGHGNFKSHHDDARDLLQQLSVRHLYREGPKREHAWGSGWLPEAVQLLVAGQSR